MSEKVVLDYEESILIIRLNRPDARNAVDAEVAKGVAAALREFNGRQDLRVAVVTGSGGTFSAGMDLNAFRRGERPTIPEYGFAGITEASIEKPIIAAVDGYALGGGFTIALACDLIVAAQDAQFGLPEVRHGLLADSGLIRLPQRVPYHLAMELALTGERMGASRAYQVGLVNRVVDSRALPGALELAGAIRSHSPAAVDGSREMVRGSKDWTEAEAWSRLPRFRERISASAHPK